MGRLLRMGEGGLLDAGRIVAVARARSAPVRRLLKHADASRVLDLTYGYPRESVVLLEGGWLALISLTPQALLNMLHEKGDESWPGKCW